MTEPSDCRHSREKPARTRYGAGTQRGGGLDVRQNYLETVLGSVDICFILYLCQQLHCLQNNGQECLSSFGVRQTYTLGRKPIVGGLSRPYYGLLGLVRSGGCSQPNTVIGTASTNDSPDGVTAEYGSLCISISSMTPTWNTSSSTAPSSGPITPLRAHPKKRRASIASPRSQPRRVQHEGSCRCRRTWQPVEIQVDRRAGARCHSGSGAHSWH